MITGGTRVLGIVGFPLGHTLSPGLHNFVLVKLGLPLRYVPFPVEDPESLGAALRGLAAAGVVGVNVTIPHKVAAAELCDELTEDAKAAGAVNTIRLGPRLVGHDTDIAGFGRVIAERRIIVTGKTVLLLGAGGAARAAAVFLRRAGAQVKVAGRTRERAEELVATVRKAAEDHLEVIEWDDRNEWARKADVLVNTTPIGMWPRVADSPIDMSAVPGAGRVVYDIVYNPARTRLVERAVAAGATVLDGLWMLIHQAFDALEFWTQKRVNRDLGPEVRRALEAELARMKPPSAGGAAGG
jgi:shikimate dehydrogenase